MSLVPSLSRSSPQVLDTDELLDDQVQPPSESSGALLSTHLFVPCFYVSPTLSTRPDSITFDFLYPNTVAHASSLSFTQGFLIGQLSVVLFLGAFIKFFIFGDAPSARQTSGVHLSTLSPTHKRAVSFTPHGSPSRHDWSPSSPRRSPSAGAGTSDPPSPPPFSHIIRPPPHLTPAALLHKTYYDVHAHPPESLDWFNVLVAQALAQLRADACADGAILESLTAVLNGPQKPAFCDKIAVTEIALGEAFPIFSNCRVHPVSDDDDGVEGSSGPRPGAGHLLARMDVDLADALTLGVETTLVLNYPRPNTARLPVALSVSVARFSGTLAISFQPAAAPPSRSDPRPTSPDPFSSGPLSAPSAFSPGPGPSHPPPPQLPTSTPPKVPTTLSFAFQPTYTLALSTRSLVGARARLQDVPKLAQLVEARLRAWFEARCVAPRRQQIAVPSLWPRMHNVVVEGEAGGAAAEGGTTTAAVDGHAEPGASDPVGGAGVSGVAATAGLAAAGEAAGGSGAGAGAGAGLGIGATPPPRLDAEALARHQAQQEQLHGGWAGLRFRGVGTGIGAGGEGEGGKGSGCEDDDVGGMPGGFA